MDLSSVPFESAVTPELDAPIVAVTVYPDRARITRRGRVRLPAGEHRVVVERLPLGLDASSVRVAGTGLATVLSVDIRRRHAPRTADETIVALEEKLRQVRTEVAVLDDDDAVAIERQEFFSGLARRSTRTYAQALATGQMDAVRATELAQALAERLAAVRLDRRELAHRRELAVERVAAFERNLDARRRQRQPDQMAALVTLLVADGATDVELDLSYVVDGAGWTSAYDLRLVADTLTLTWFGLVSQRTGEDWPECDLRLSTARPAGTSVVPELDPWFLDRWRPVSVPQAKMMRAAFEATPGFAMPAPAMAQTLSFGGREREEAVPIVESVASIEQGMAAATYTPARPVAVPADGGAHRASVAVVELAAARDYVTAPVLNDAVYLRATVINSSPHTLPAGVAAIFHEGDFVGTTTLAVWAPGEETELALGVDDRVRVERELVRRTATKAVLGATRRRDAEHRITVANHTGRGVRVTVLDQLPVSRDEGIVVRDLRLDPAPEERTEMGVLSWRIDLSAGESKEIHIGVRVELARGVEMTGWRE